MRTWLSVVAMLVVGCGGAVDDGVSSDAPEEAARRVDSDAVLGAEQPVADVEQIGGVVGVHEGTRPPLAAPKAVGDESDPPLYVFAPDAELRAALEPIVTELLDAGHDVRWRGHCSWNVRCVHAFWEGITLPERSRLACPDDVPLRRELSVDASLEGEALAGALRLQMGRAVAMTECVRTAKMYAP